MRFGAADTKASLIEKLATSERLLKAANQRATSREATLERERRVARKASIDAVDAREAEKYWRRNYNDLSRKFTLAKQEQSDSNVRVVNALKKETEVREALRVARNERTRLQRALKKATEPKPMDKSQEAIFSIASDMFRTVDQNDLLATIKEIVTDDSMKDSLMHLMERRGEMSSEEAMVFAGIGMNPMARKHFDQALDAYWKKTENLGFINLFIDREVIVGAGVHGAIYAAERHRKTGVRPIVFDMADRAGGSFAVTSGPAFYLNSRNRPGPLSIPGDEFGALNVLPGAAIQPSELGGEEYLTNDAIAWSVRATLLMHADLRLGLQIERSEFVNQGARIYAPGVSTGRTAIQGVTFAVGLTIPKRAFQITDERYLTFSEFFRRMDQAFPLRGMRRVAVIGSGDGGKTVVEALTGQGPTSAMTVPTLDYVEKIDWYGVPSDQRERVGWEQCNRSRYKGIGRLLPNGGKPFRVMPLDVPSYADMGYDCVKIDGLPYDYVIDCTGYESQALLPDGYEMFRENEAGQALGKRVGAAINSVGPGCQLAAERYEGNVLGGVAENATSIWRYAERTARFARAV